MKRILIALLVIVILLLGYGYYRMSAEDRTQVPVVPAGEPTDFVAYGTIEFEGENMHGGTPRLIIETESATTSLALLLDTESICAAPNGALPCMAMSVTLDVPFDGKTAIVEGILQDDGRVLVRRMRALTEGEEPMLPEAGAVFTPWVHALAQLESCNVEMAMQTHALDVYLTLKDGTRIHTIEPVIDEIFAVLDRTRATCGTIPVATE
jgi:hypothetical protein